jgi:5-(carboxyamino)imidazole ribonucleotide synthase
MPETPHKTAADAAVEAERRSFAPGATIGILGGGQLGRMTALAAAHLGYRSHIFCQDAGEPAAQVTSLSTVAPFDDEAALTRFAAAVDVVTLEFENVPLASAEFLAARVPLRPSAKVLSVCQNRLREKDFLASIEVPTTRYAEVGGPEAVARELRHLGTPAVLKSAEFGYDGKGQVLLKAGIDPVAAWAEMAGHAPQAVGILEGFVDFHMEISVIVARGVDGAMATYVPVENQHRNHILDQTVVPARIATETADRAEMLARRVAEALDLVGLIAVEMFVAADGQVLVNELAPRPHNSGHWTLDAAVTSQFEQQVRAVAGLPLGSTERLCDAVMKNLLGDEIDAWRDHLAEPAAKLHLYGKAAARPGRKMGHVTRLLRGR